MRRQLTKDLNLRFASPTSLRLLRKLGVPLDAELGPALPQPLAGEGSIRRAIGQLTRCADEVERRSRRELVRTVAQEHVQVEVRAAQDAEFAKEYRATKLRLNPVIGLTRFVLLLLHGEAFLLLQGGLLLLVLA